MTTSRVYPGSSDTMDMGVSSISYRGGSISTMGHAEMETQRARMTLEEARWTGVRKKIPGMSGIPARPRTTGQQSADEIDPFTKFMNEQRTFIRQHFRQKECSRFVPKPGQKVKKSRDLKCHCGDILTEHAGMQGPFPHFSSEGMMEDFIIPKELRRIMSKERRNDPPPEIFPNVSWDAKQAIRVTATCTYGKINFINVEQAGGKKPAKYIRMTDEDSVDNLIELMKTFWKIEQPEKPHLVITVIGGAKNFKLDGRMRDTFSTGLIKAAKTTNAWLISSGFNMGVMKSVGQAVRQGQSFCWDNNRMAHVLRCIAIAPWGYVKNRRQLESIDGQGKFNADFHTSNVILHDNPVPLNPDHTHFIFVDDGYRIRYGGVSGIRAQLEQKISAPVAELRRIMSKERRNDPPPEIFPNVSWDAKQAIRVTATCTYGKINFINVEQAGGKKPAKYIRMTDEDSVDNLIELMKTFWKIEQPEKPHLVITVIGGAKNFKLDGRMRDTFSTGLIKAAKTTNAWLISSGFNMGVMKSVGQAVRQGQSFCWDNNRMAHVLRCIAIAPWGYVKNRRQLESIDGQGKFNADFHTSNVILHDNPVPLNPDHTHFIFVDDGYRIRYGGVSGIRAQLEQKISAPVAEGGLGIPVVLVVVEGGTDCIADAKKSLEHNIPVVVCAGTGRAADILAYAYKHTKTTDAVRQMKMKYVEKLKDKIFEAYGKNWKEEEKEKKKSDLAESVQKCCENAEMLTVFYMNKHEDLDLAILSVLLKAKKGTNEPQRLSQLQLALTWDRVDIAQEEIFREDVLWERGSLDEVMTVALLKNKVKFVELILQQGVVMKEYLTVQRLEQLYKEVPRHSYIYKVMHKVIGKESLTLANVHLMLCKLLDKYDTTEESYLEITVDENGIESLKPTTNHGLLRFQRPYKMLLVWAILMKRQQLAKLFWELGEEPITSAISASRIYHAMARHLPRHESNLKDTLMETKFEFEQLATEILDECHHKDPDKAMMVVERKSPCWNEMTCLQIAAAATDQVFLSSVTCQNSINMIWKHGILASWHKVVLGMMFPPYIAYGVEILNLGERGMTGWQKLGAFYSSPLSKFSHGMLMYALFLLLYSYMLLVDFQPDRTTPLEWVMIIWVLTYLIDEIHTFIAFPSPTIRSKVRDWYGFIKWIDVINLGFAFIGFIIHLTSSNYMAVKVIYCINSVIFFLRIMKIYITNGMLGPKIFMIQRMVDELRMFVMVLFVFLLAYGVASQGLLYHARSPSWVILKDVIYFPYWQLYGEIFLEELETDGNCTAESVDCRTYHWLVPILLAAYLLVGNILLLNLLIAIFSHVFETVEKNSIEIWKYQMYFLVMEFENKTMLVPPFSIIQHVYLIGSWTYRKCCRDKKRSKQNYSRRHLEYLQLFEKEMMMNHLRQVKAEEMSGIEMTINKLQKRVDELTKLIEEDLIADQPMEQVFIDGQAVTFNPDQKPEGEVAAPGWSVLKRSMTEPTLPPVKEQQEEVVETEKKRKHKKKKKHKNKEKDLDNEKQQILETKLNNINLPPNIASGTDKPEPPSKFHRRSSERGLLPEFLMPDDSGTGTDNGPITPKPSRRATSLERGKQDFLTASKPPVSTPEFKRRSHDSSDENLFLRSPRLRHRISGDIMEQMSSSDSEERSPRSSYRRLKSKKARHRSVRLSDTD